jgi:hypothetical protein
MKAGVKTKYPYRSIGARTLAESAKESGQHLPAEKRPKRFGKPGAASAGNKYP